VEGGGLRAEERQEEKAAGTRDTHSPGHCGDFAAFSEGSTHLLCSQDGFISGAQSFLLLQITFISSVGHTHRCLIKVQNP
jgi:hypothetical protein